MTFNAYRLWRQSIELQHRFKSTKPEKWDLVAVHKIQCAQARKNQYSVYLNLLKWIFVGKLFQISRITFCLLSVIDHDTSRIWHPFMFYEPTPHVHKMGVFHKWCTPGVLMPSPLQQGQLCWGETTIDEDTWEACLSLILLRHDCPLQFTIIDHQHH